MNGAAELSSVVLPLGAELQYLYTDFTNAAGITVRGTPGGRITASGR
jgi:hypothetical protein